MALLGDTCDLYEDGEHGGARCPQLGAVAGRIEEILPAAEIIRRTVEEFEAVLGELARPLPRRRGPPDVDAADGRPRRLPDAGRRLTPVSAAAIASRGRTRTT